MEPIVTQVPVTALTRFRMLKFSDPDYSEIRTLFGTLRIFEFLLYFLISDLRVARATRVTYTEVPHSGVLPTNLIGNLTLVPNPCDWKLLICYASGRRVGLDSKKRTDSSKRRQM